MILIILAIVAFFFLGGIKTSKAIGNSAQEFSNFLNVKSGSMTDAAIIESIQEEAELKAGVIESTGCSVDELDAEIKAKRKRYNIK